MQNDCKERQSDHKKIQNSYKEMQNDHKVTQNNQRDAKQPHNYEINFKETQNGHKTFVFLSVCVSCSYAGRI